MSSTGSDSKTSATGSAAAQHLPRQLNLRDLVLSQVLNVVGSSWVGIAAGLGHAQTVVWLLAFGTFYLPMAAAVYYLNREMPLEGGLYVWTRRAFGDTAGFLVAWNVWAYALCTIALILFQIPSEFAYMVGARAAWIPENHLVVFCFLAAILTVLGLSAVRGLAIGKWIHNISGIVMIASFALLIFAPLWALRHHAPIHFAPFDLQLPESNAISLALTVLCVIGFCATLFSCATSVYPFVDVPNPLHFAIKITATILVTNLIGYAFYRIRGMLAPAPTSG